MKSLVAVVSLAAVLLLVVACGDTGQPATPVTLKFDIFDFAEE